MITTHKFPILWWSYKSYAKTGADLKEGTNRFESWETISVGRDVALNTSLYIWLPTLYSNWKQLTLPLLFYLSYGSTFCDWIHWKSAIDVLISAYFQSYSPKQLKSIRTSNSAVTGLSRSKDLILELWTPNFLCAPEQWIHTSTPRFTANHVGSKKAGRVEVRLL